MAKIIEKEILCQIGLEDFAVESIGSVPFVQRYREFCNLMKRKTPNFDFERTFAEPVVNSVSKVVEWYYCPGTEPAIRLSEIKKTNEILYNSYCKKRSDIISVIKKAASNASENEKEYFNVLCTNLESEHSDTFTYGYDDNILFGIWGMNMKKGRQIMSVVTDGKEDQRTYSITYHVEGQGLLKPFNKIHRRHGHILQGENDIPQPIADEDYEFKEWLPEPPFGKPVTNNKGYTAVFRHKESANIESKPNDNAEIDDDIDTENTPEPESDTGNSISKHIVSFTADEHLTLHGDTQFEKNHNDVINKDEIPGIETDRGYEFVEWDKNPEGYIVDNDVNFHARCRKIEKAPKFVDRTPFAFWPFLHNLLKWLLLLLLLALVVLFLWYLLGNHNLNFCGCNCDDDTVLVVPDPPTKRVIPKEYDCNSTVASGRDEGYVGYVDMHQDTGTFQFHYDTRIHRDSIVIYDGKGINGNVIFRYGGGTNGWKNKMVKFNNRFITIKVRAIDSSTFWNFTVDCPN